MPFYRKRRRRFYPKRRTYKRRRVSRYFKRSGRMTPKRPMPTKTLFKARYVDHGLSIDSSSVTPGQYTFNLSSLYDPDSTSTGHQPMGFDQMMLMYNHYTVIGARITATFSNISTNYAQRVYGYLAPSLFVNTDFNSLAENGLCKKLILQPKGTDKATQSMSFNVSHKKYFGARDILGESNFSGTVSSSPVENVYLTFVNDSIESVDPDEVKFDIRIEYLAILHEPKKLNSS